MVDIGLFLAYILTGLCIIIAIGMPLVKAFGDPDALKKMGIGIGALLAVFFIAYFTSSGEAEGDYSKDTVKLVGAGIVTFYILAIAAVLGIVYTEVKKAFE
ncbi:MAG: hypothetical protein GDA51_14185 [Ekhidna sp.]|nr:hypothetical protein [Ekhidna sp.]MBC6410799.1 hypothetical protein [Ekhidna sp.]MBC6427577.1 hypothetical protein [Ekhidna sp.]